MNKVPRLVFCYVGNKTFDFSSKKKDFLPKNDQIWPKIGIFGQFGPGHAGLFGALLVGRLVVVARRLYLARHLFTLYRYYPTVVFNIIQQVLHFRYCRQLYVKFIYSCVLYAMKQFNNNGPDGKERNGKGACLLNCGEVGDNTWCQSYVLKSVLLV